MTFNFYRPDRDLASRFHDRPKPDVSDLPQWWRCECGLRRQYGFGLPIPAKPGPAWLFCLRCEDVTRHTFAEVAA